MRLLDRTALLAPLALLSLAACSGGTFEVGGASPDAADGSALDAVALDSTAPDSTAPDSTAPDSSAPDAADAADAADARAPDATAPHDAADAADGRTDAADAAADTADTADTADATDTAEGGSGGTPCTYGASATCGPDGYCDAPGCGTGVCKARAKTEIPTRAPVCGCDGVSYWNATVAATHGMAVASSGPCATPKPCGGFVGTSCPSGALCNYRLVDKSSCGASDVGGTCWAIPGACPPTVAGAQAHGCTSNTCTDECNQIKDGATWFPDPTCP